MDINAEERQLVLKTFLIESGERLSEMEEALVEFEASPDNLEILDKIFRSAHTLKGNSLSLEFDEIGKFIHGTENLLQKLRIREVEVTGEIVTLLLQSIDMLRHMIPDGVAGVFVMQPAHLELIRQIESAANGLKSEETSQPQTGGLPQGAEKRRRPWGRRREDIHELIDKTRSIRVGSEKLDRLLNLMGEITLSQGRIKEELKIRNDLKKDSFLQDIYTDTDPLLTELQDQIMKLRMVPVGPSLRHFIRVVRDIAKSHDKLAKLVIEGEEAEIDSTFIEALRDPLTHMIRNAVDHGIESPELRRGGGKNPCGLLTLRVYHDSGSIVIQLQDDGAGLRKKEILQKAVALGLAKESNRLSDQDIYRFIFEPGFSTSEKITDISGRGVGMDVVQKGIDSLRGTIEIRSQEKKGTIFTIRLPLTMAIISGFVVGVGEERYVIPLDSVVECLDLSEARDFGNRVVSSVHRAGSGRKDEKEKGSGFIDLRGKALPYCRLREHFQLGGKAGTRENAVVIQHHDMKAALVVDSIYGEIQAVVKPLGELFKELPGVTGSTILGNGKVGLILEVASLIKNIEVQNHSLLVK
ncbi:MAG: chemotaxis protein CheA [Nitrospirae bacterium]|nr:chemotaxis protein CheA [Nitrospirota bacterium]MBI3595377.1 chemotaxis protein CheA [Nitrospirota bacterium]